MSHHAPRRTDAAPRRGMLLLLVLSILALFVVVGAVGILVAIRARETARAFAAASAAARPASGALARAQLDAALLRLIRGPSGPGGMSESLLEDKYGPPQTCQITGLTSATSTFITGTVTGLDLSTPAAVAGRVLTFVPAVNDPTGPTSYRILRTGTIANTVLLANVKPNTPLPLPSVFPCDAIVNGREFAAESYDAFDPQNPFLTQPVLENSRVTSVARPAFGAPDAACEVDNDGDGKPDGIWLEGVLPAQQSSDGGQLTFAVSYLVLDLDGRINLNAHGSYVRAQLPPSPYPSGTPTVPIGMGYGPADVDAARLVATAAEATATATTVPARWALLLRGGTVTPRASTASTATQWRPAPQVEVAQPGRYTLGTTYTTASPGNTNSASSSTSASNVNADFWMLNPIGNSPTDLRCRLRVHTVAGSPPTLTFARPVASGSWVVATPDTTDITATGTNVHPYALRLDEDSPRAAGTNAIDALYTVGELERILRAFDADAATLAPRLAAMLDDRAERSRLTVTTDSWDTPAVTGTTATRIAAAVTGSDPYAVLSPETVAGLRFNLNRPLASGTTATATSFRQEYFRQLYTLMVAITGTAAADDAAQWAANVVEFRDPDSTMTWYRYDRNPLDGVWDAPATSTTGVWGIERPEVAITEASVSSGQLTVRLMRPWAAQCIASNTVSAERIDANLGVSGTTNTLNLARLSGADPVWRLVVVGSATAGLNTLAASGTAVRTNSGTSVTLPAPGSPMQVVLQRLASPATARTTDRTSANYNDYVDVHRVNLSTPARQISRWLHWPNRDFVSHGELLAVPSGDPGLVPEAFFGEAGEVAMARVHPAILDATIVPSRFTGASVSVVSGSTRLARTGYENFQHGQYSRWREPGRVNVNTVLRNGANDPAALDDAVWKALVGRDDAPNPVTSGAYAPVQTLLPLLTGTSPTAPAPFDRSGDDARSAFLKRSTAIRLANTATTRSHVFAVWITLRITDSSPNAGPPQFARLFAIVDRSIPVACAPGRTLNVRETIRLQRFLQ